MGDHTDFAQEKQLSLQCRTKSRKSWKTYPIIWTFRLWNFEQPWSVFHFHLSVTWYCVGCLSWTSWKPWCNVHDFCGCHLKCWWSLFSEHCFRNRIICYNVTSEYDPAFVYFWYWGSSSDFLRWQRSINDAKWTFLSLFLAPSITSFLVLTFVSCHDGIFSNVSHVSPHCCLCIWNFKRLRHRNEFVNKTVMCHRIHPFVQWCDLDEICVQLLLALVSCFRRHQQYKHILSCNSEHCGGFHLSSLTVLCKAFMQASELPTFYERLSVWAWILRRLAQWRIFPSIV